VNRFHRYYCASPGWARLVQTTLVPAVLEGAELGPRVLEIGPGPGLTTEVLAGVAPELTAVELDPELATVARDRVPAVQVVQGDATTMPFADATFSAVVCLTMLHHLPSPELQDRLFGEVHRVLGPGGVFCGSDNPGRGLKSSISVTTRLSSIPPASGNGSRPPGSSRHESAPDHGSCSTPADRASR
jgi:SAM-dependent methyltransferase